MASLKYRDKYNQVGFLKKPKESAGFAEIVDFLKGSHIRYALTHSPTIHDSLVKQFWQTATASTLADGTLELRATIDTHEYTIIKASVRSKLQLVDASGISMFPNTEIFEGMGNMGYPTDGSFTFWKSFFTPQWRFLVHHILHCISPKSGGYDQFGSNIATALICLSTGRVKQIKLELNLNHHHLQIKAWSRISSKTKQTMGECNSEVGEEGRNLQKDELEVFETPKQGKSSGETDISPQGLEAAETLAEALNVSTGFEDVSTGFEDVSTGFTDIKFASEKVSSGGEHVSQREGMAVIEETPQIKRTKKQIREEQASLAEIARYKLRLKLEANADLLKEIAGEDVSEADLLRDMRKRSRKRTGVELKHIFQEAKIAEERPDSAKSALRRMLKPHGGRVDEPSSESFQ
ncbi:hypothetical protein Tco_1577188 [Tanacetum coccineum]